MFLNIAIAILVVWLGIRGWRRGLVGEIIETIGVIAALLATVRLYPMLEDALGLASTWGRIIAAALIFLAIMLILTLIGKGLRKLFEHLSLRPFEKTLGMIFGAAKAGLISAVLCAVLLRAGPQGKEMIENSILARTNLVLFSWVANFLPDEWEKKVDDALST